MSQTQQVIDTLRKLGGIATFGKLNSIMDFSNWKTKTPEASVRRIVQQSSEFFRIRPGLWALTEQKNEILATLNLSDEKTNNYVSEEFNHSYYQGLLVDIGNLKQMTTYVPNQDKNKLFLTQPLHEIATYSEPLCFTYPEIISRAKTVDVIWFNERRMPNAFFEVEHTTDIQNSLLKFYELQDFYAKFFIVANEYRENKFNEIMNRSVFSALKKRIEFKSYNTIVELHTQACREAKLQTI